MIYGYIRTSRAAVDGLAGMHPETQVQALADAGVEPDRDGESGPGLAHGGYVPMDLDDGAGLHIEVQHRHLAPSGGRAAPGGRVDPRFGLAPGRGNGSS